MGQVETPRPVAARPASQVGAMLREWRERRRYSQLALALRADISARHLSFVETGRARPSREMLLHLAEWLEIPHGERNALLAAAGYAPEFRDLRWDDPALREVREAVRLVLDSMDPNPALAVDRRWTLLAHNRAAGALLAGVAPELAEPPVNVLRASLHPRGLASCIVNLAQWRAHVLARLRRDVELTGDPVLAALREELRAYPVGDADGDEEPSAGDGAGESAGLPVLIPLRLRTDAGVLSFVSTTTVFGTALDTTVAGLAIEAFLPADEETAGELQRLAGGATPRG